MEMNKLLALDYTIHDRCMRECDKVALDIGANIGGNTATMLSYGFKVHAFEPVPDCYGELVKRFSGNPNVFLSNLGMSDKKESLNDVEVLSTWTLGKADELKMDVALEYLNTKFDVELTTIDEYVSKNNLEIGFIKLDVDGYEHKVLQGGEKTILKQHPPMMIELNCYIPKISGRIEDFINYIFYLGYDIVSMSGQYVAKTWAEVKPYYPYHSSYDVMLIPR